MASGEYTLSLDLEKKLVRVVVLGDIDKTLGYEIITNARTTAAEYQFAVLYDVRRAQMKVAFADWFFLPRTLPVFKTIKTRVIKVAILINQEANPQNYQFYRTVLSNLGMSFNIFIDESEAEAWLASPTNELN